MSAPTDAEVSTAAIALIEYMLSHQAKDHHPPSVAAIHMARVALTAAAHVRYEQAVRDKLAMNDMAHRCPICGGHHNIGNPCPGPDCFERQDPSQNKGLGSTKS